MNEWYLNLIRTFCIGRKVELQNDSVSNKEEKHEWADLSKKNLTEEVGVSNKI